MHVICTAVPTEQLGGPAAFEIAGFSGENQSINVSAGLVQKRAVAEKVGVFAEKANLHADSIYIDVRLCSTVFVCGNAYTAPPDLLVGLLIPEFVLERAEVLRARIATLRADEEKD